MANDTVKFEILRCVLKRDGERYWYQIDRAISGVDNRVGPFFSEIKELIAHGLIEVRPNPALDDIPRTGSRTKAGTCSPLRIHLFRQIPKSPEANRQLPAGGIPDTILGYGFPRTARRIPL